MFGSSFLLMTYYLVVLIYSPMFAVFNGIETLYCTDSLVSPARFCHCEICVFVAFTLRLAEAEVAYLTPRTQFLVFCLLQN